MCEKWLNVHSVPCLTCVSCSWSVCTYGWLCKIQRCGCMCTRTNCGRGELHYVVGACRPRSCICNSSTYLPYYSALGCRGDPSLPLRRLSQGLWFRTGVQLPSSVETQLGLCHSKGEKSLINTVQQYSSVVPNWRRMVQACTWPGVLCCAILDRCVYWFSAIATRVKGALF